MDRREVSALSLWDARAILTALQSDRLYSAFIVALYKGLRAGELAGLRVEDIDLVNGPARVHQQVRPVTGEGLAVRRLKTHASTGSLDLIPEAVAVVSDEIADGTEEYVWESAPATRTGQGASRAA